MKVDTAKILGALILALLSFIAHQVWQGVEIAKENRTHRLMQAEDIKEIKADLKDLRSDLDQLWGATNDLAREGP